MTAVVGVWTHFLDEALLFSEDEDGVEAFVAEGDWYSRGWWRVETMIVEDGIGVVRSGVVGWEGEAAPAKAERS